MSDENRKPAATEDRRQDGSSAAHHSKSSHVTERTVVNHEDGLMPTAENIVATLLVASGLRPATNQQETAMPTPAAIAKATGAQMVDATNAAKETVVDTVKEVGGTIAGSAAKAGKKLEKDDDSLGPYGSPGTCAPSDMDPVAEAVHSGLPLQNDESASEVDGG